MYQAVVARLAHLVPHPKSDRGLQVARVSGYTVVVGPEQKDGDLGIFFPTDGQLSPDFAMANDLMEKIDPVTNQKVGGGMFKSTLRVTAQSIRGVKSYGFWIPIASLSYIPGLDYGQFTEGYCFDTLKVYGQLYPICRKYITQATAAAAAAAMKQGGDGRKETEWFPMHVDTDQWRQNRDKVEDLSLLTITEKVHGTSHRFGYVWDEREPRIAWLQKIFGIKPKKVRKLVYMSGTRRVILKESTGDQFYGDPFRTIAVQRFIGKLFPGEIVYFEIVGYTMGGKPIMEPQETSKVDELKKKYPPRMVYSYGCKEGEFRVLVYRMGMMTEEARWIEYPWALVKRRCREINVAYVPELVNTFAFGIGDLEFVEQELEALVQGPSIIDSSHIREGAVVRVDTPDARTFWLKHKSWVFLFLEGVLKERPEFVDAEEAA
jgi:hypothetical protein